MRFRIITLGLAVILLAEGLASAGDSAGKKREKTRKMAGQILQELYKAAPGAKAAIEKSAGYAVFNNMGTNLLQGEYSTRLRNRHKVADQAGNPHEDDFGRRRSGSWSKGLSGNLRVRER